jgi:hypothetical protein
MGSTGSDNSSELHNNRLNGFWQARMVQERHKKVGWFLERVALAKCDKRSMFKGVEKPSDSVEGHRVIVR